MDYQFWRYFNSANKGGLSLPYLFYSEASSSVSSVSFTASANVSSVSFTASVSASGLSVDKYQRFYINRDLYEC